VPAAGNHEYIGRIAPKKLSLRAYLNAGVVYDGFALVKADAGNRLEDLPGDPPTARR